MDGAATVGKGTLSTSNGVSTATISVADLAVGSHTLVLLYNGDARNLTSSSQSVNLQVSPDTTSVVLAESVAAPVFGQNETFTAKIAVASPGAGTPTGTVTFKDGNATIGTGKLTTTNGVTSATLVTAALAVGSHSITAVYAGDASDLRALRAALSFKVGQDATSVVLAESVAAPVFGQNETFTAKIAVASPGAGTPTGTVTFKDGNATIGTAKLTTANGVTTPTLATAARQSAAIR